ncbi:MAG: hypothetical protein GC168_18275 [Candidatus Hydrogenedens sp.]|nr:hypothetical protein [Candidatus Hydrogenedens sp.]
MQYRNKAARRGRLAIVLGALALAYGLAHAQTAANPLTDFNSTATVAPGQDLAAAVNTAAPKTNIRLEAGGTYDLTADIMIGDNNDGVLISGPGGAVDNRPDKTIINANGHRITVTQDKSMTLADLTINGTGGVAIIAATGSTVTVGRCLLTQGAPVIDVYGLAGKITTVHLIGSVVAATAGGVRQNDDNTVVNVWQCTFISAAPAGIESNGGSANIVASLFATPGDAPRTGPSAISGNFRWAGSLIDIDNTAPATYTQEVGAQAVAPTVIPFKSAPDAWLGELDDASLPLISGTPSNSAVPAVSAIRDVATFFATTDFEGDKRASVLQVGADELGAGLFQGWEASFIDIPVAGANRTVMINILTRGIDLNDGAILLVVPELSVYTDPDLLLVGTLNLPVNAIDDNLGLAEFTVPGSACIDGLMLDGLAQLYLYLPNAGRFFFAGDPDSTVPLDDTRFVIDTVAPTYGTISGVDAASLAYYQLSDEIGAPGFSVPGGAVAPAGWGPAIAGGIAPSNAASLRSTDTRPQIFLNWNVAAVPSFSFSASFVDYPPSPCEDGGGTPGTIAGMQAGITAIANDRTELSALYAPVDLDSPLLGGGFLYGGEPADLTDYSAANLMTATMVGATDNSDGFSNLVVTWNLTNFAYTSNWNAEFKIGATDLAGNEFRVPAPLRFWWMPPQGFLDNSIDGLRVSLSGPGSEENPTFSWSLRRSVDPPDSAPSVPLASYRLWIAEDPSDTSGAYSAVTDWSGYQSDRTITGGTVLPNGLTLRDFLELPTSLGQTFAMTVKAADQAGNFQESALSLAGPLINQAFVGNRIDNLGDWVNAFSSTGINEVAFVTWTNSLSPGGAIDTRVRARLWWNRVPVRFDGSEGTIDTYDEAVFNERDFGASTRIPLPPEDDCGNGIFTRIEAAFDLSASSTGADQPIDGVTWALYEEGRLLDQRDVSAAALSNPLVNPVQLPRDLDFNNALALLQSSPCAGIGGGDRFGDEGDPNAGKRARNIRYTFSAAAFTLVADPFGGTTPIPVYDETPATFQFVVTVTDDAGTGEQPIKVFSPNTN